KDVLLFQDSSFFLASGDYLYKNDQGKYVWNVFMLRDQYDGNHNDCDSVLNINSFSTSMNIQLVGPASRELYMANSAYNMLSVETGIFDFLTECDIITTAVDEFSETTRKVLLYPNPASSFINIKSSHIKTIKIIDF